jgi:hypothetical protein
MGDRRWEMEFSKKMGQKDEAMWRVSVGDGTMRQRQRRIVIEDRDEPGQKDQSLLTSSPTSGRKIV